MKKKIVKRVVSFATAVMMALTATLIGGVEETKAEESAQEIILQDADFDGSFWNDGIWSCTTSAWSGTTDVKSITRDEASVKAFEFWRDGAGDVTLTQTVASLEAGTYRITVDATGKNATVKMKINDNISEAVAISDNYSSWSSLSNTITLATAASNATVGFVLEATDGGAQIDKVKLEKIATTSENPTPPAEVTYSYELTIVQNETTVSDSSTEDGVATIGEGAVFTAKIIKVGSDGSEEEVNDLTGYHLYWYDKTADATTADVLTFTVNKDTAGAYWFDVTLQDSEWKDLDKTWFGVAVSDLTNEGGTTTPEGGSATPEGDTTTTPDAGSITETKPVEKPVVIELENSSFTGALDGTWKGEIAKGEWQDGNDLQKLDYSTDSYLQLPDYVGTSGVKFNMEQGNTMTVLQWVDSLKAGTYTITAPVMGENTDIYLVLGDKEIKATSLSGYNNWTKAKANFKLTEDMTDVKVGFKLVATSSGSDSWSWGWIDSIKLIKTVPKTGDSTNAYAYVMLMMAGLAIVGYSVKRNKA